jgi:hypothetical protein
LSAPDALRLTCLAYTIPSGFEGVRIESFSGDVKEPFVVLVFGPGPVFPFTEPRAVAADPSTSYPQKTASEKAFDWKAELRDLKETFDAGLLPEDLYKSEVAGVMRRRSEVR